MANSPITATLKTDVSGTDSARVFTGGSKLIESQASDASGNSGQIGGTQAGGDITDNSITNVTTADPTVAAQAISAVSDVSKQFGSQLTDFLTKTGAQSSQTLQTALGSIGTLSQGAQQQVADNAASGDTSGASRFIKPALIALGIIAAVVAVALWRKK